MTLDKQAILEAARMGVQTYITRYNTENESYVDVSLGDPAATDHGSIDIDGGGVHGAWTLVLEEL